MQNYPKAANGLKLLFIAEVLNIVAVVLAIIPALGAILGIVGTVVSLVGLYKASGDEKGYHTAFIIMIANLVLGVIAGFAGGILATIVSIASTVLGLAVVYYVINSTSALAQNMGNSELVGKGQKLWKFYLICTVLIVVATVLTFIPVLAGILAIVGAILQLIAYIRYLIFLNNGSKVLA